MAHDDTRPNDSDRVQYERDRPLIEFMDAVETVAVFIGGDEGERIRRALLDLAHLPEPVPPQQLRLPDLTVNVPF